MQPLDKIKEYSETVCNQIRWKKAHPVIAEEIKNHLCDQRDAYIAEGTEESTATNMAIKQMGDPVLVGMGLDKTHKPKAQWGMLAFTMILFMTGFLIRIIAKDSFDYSTRDNFLIPAALGLGVFFMMYFIDFTILGRFPKVFFFFMLLIGSMGAFISVTRGGGNYFLVMSPFSLGLSYISLLYPLAFAALIYSLRNKGYLGIVLCEVGYAALAFVLLKISRMSGLFIFSIAAFCLLLTAILKGWFQVKRSAGVQLVVVPAIILLLIVGFYILKNPYYYERLAAALGPQAYPKAKGYLSNMLGDLLANSRFIGKGALPTEYHSADIIPLYYTDFILSHLIYNYGWITFLVICALFAGFSAIGVKYVLKQKSVLGLLVSLSVIITIICQVAMYVVSNLGFNLLATLPLPLISYGNTSLVLNMALIGIMLSVFRTGDIARDRRMTNKGSHPFIYRDGDKLIIHLK
jgi:cell division protein FtsW (lipid II flippase)